MTYFTAHQKETRLIVQSDESTTNDSGPNNDPELFFEAEANSNYELIIFIKSTCASATPDLRYEMSTLTSASWIMSEINADQDTAGLGSTIGTLSSGESTFGNVPHSGTSAEMWTRLQCSYVTEGTAGIVYFRWAQNTSNATALIRKAGSHMIVRKIGNNPT